jgi:ABC-type multidrug transport system ATPase subunit
VNPEPFPEGETMAMPVPIDTSPQVIGDVPHGQMSSVAPLAIETHGLTRRYDAMVAVDHLDLKVRQGEVYGFLGPNGAGKTTTLRMLLGLIAPTSGSMSLLGAPAGSGASLSRIGSMIETPAFYPFLSGRDNLKMLAAYTGVNDRRIDEVLGQVDLAGRAKDPFRAYSLGMKQRLGVAAALLKDPPLLMLDEPTNGLDPAGMADMRELIRRLGDEGRTVLLSSHLMNEVEQVCDRVGVIARGKIVAEGTVNDLRGREALLIRVDQPLPARELLKHEPDIAGIEISGTALRITMAEDCKADAAGWNRLLVGAGIAVRELRSDRRSLEEIFLTLTGGEERHAI